MVAFISTSTNIPEVKWHFWAGINLKNTPQVMGEEVRGLHLKLEKALENILDDWLRLGRRLGANTSASFAHTPSCALNVSDLGIMLAWDHLVQGWVEGEKTVLVICDDPWLFRHFVSLGAQAISSQPVLGWRTLYLWMRGVFSRTRVAIYAILNMLLLRGQRRSYPIASSAILAYGHPASTTDGYDGYFGNLMREVPNLMRVLHVDCGYEKVRRLSKDGRTYSLHAWGSLWLALSLPLKRWRPRDENFPSRYLWLIRRAAAIEGSTGQAAAIGWQQICHNRWLAEALPNTVTWPWENHAWERHFVAIARNFSVRTLGYQHTPFGRQDYGFSPISNPRGLDNVPDLILCCGQACQETLQDMGYPADRLLLSGSLRFLGFKPPAYDASGPVLFALPYSAIGAVQMAEVANDMFGRGNRVLVKRHPMATKKLDQAHPEIITNTLFQDLPGISALVFANSSIGMEAMFGGIPAIRFLPYGTLLLDATPEGVKVQSAFAGDLEKEIKSTATPTPVNVDRFYGPVDFSLWNSLLACN